MPGRPHRADCFYPASGANRLRDRGSMPDMPRPAASACRPWAAAPVVGSWRGPYVYCSYAVFFHNYPYSIRGRRSLDISGEDRHFWEAQLVFIQCWPSNCAMASTFISTGVPRTNFTSGVCSAFSKPPVGQRRCGRCLPISQGSGFPIDFRDLGDHTGILTGPDLRQHHRKSIRRFRQSRAEAQERQEHQSQAQYKKSRERRSLFRAVNRFQTAGRLHHPVPAQCRHAHSGGRPLPQGRYQCPDVRSAWPECLRVRQSVRHILSSLRPSA